MQMNDDFLKHSISDAKSLIREIIEEDIEPMLLLSKVEMLNFKMDSLQNLTLYSDEKSFIETVCAMQIVTNNFNEELKLGEKFSTEFRERQFSFLNNISEKFNIEYENSKKIPVSIEDEKKKLKKEFDKKLEETKKEYNKKNVKETVDEIIKETNEKLDSFFHSQEDIKKYLSFMANFYNYSIGNCALIQSQFIGAHAVGSFLFWKNNGFKVNRGEKGIKILVPTPIKAFIDKDGNEKLVSKANKEEKEEIKSGKIKTFTKSMRYKHGYVFDISQTNATADDLPKLFPNKWLDGSILDYEKFYKGCEKVAENINVKIVEPKYELGVAKGVSYTGRNEVALNPRNSELQNIKTLIHELAHAKLHTADKSKDYTKEEKEFEAEMVAYAVCSYFNIDTSEYSLNYLHHYSDKDIREKRKLLNEIKETCSEFIPVIEEALNEKDTTKEIEKNNELKEQNNKNEVFVKFVWSENERIKDNSIYSFEAANSLMANLEAMNRNKDGYDKTKFEIYLSEECSEDTKIYQGRFDAGDGYATDLKEHLYKTFNSDIFDLTEKEKKAFFYKLGINENNYNKTAQRNNEKEYSL